MTTSTVFTNNRTQADRLPAEVRFPAEVEALLHRHPAVQEVCIIATRDPYRGESVKACIILRTDANEAPVAVTPEDIIAWCREHNLRGMKESVRTLLPIFLGFVATHAILVIAAITTHSTGLAQLVPNAVAESHSIRASDIGWFAVLALFFKAFSLGGGTYTGLEAVSNSINSLAEPRVRTGKATMWAIAFSLAFMAAGIIAMYLLWDVHKVEGETLNATSFKMVTADWSVLGVNISTEFTAISLLFAAGLLFVAANTGFIAGPCVMAAMAIDRWMPHMFSALSNRLVTKNGVLLMEGMAVGALLATGGKVDVLVVMYSINVFKLMQSMWLLNHKTNSFL